MVYRRKNSWLGTIITFLLFCGLLGIGIKYFGLSAVVQPFVHSWQAWLGGQGQEAASMVEGKNANGLKVGIWRFLEGIVHGDSQRRGRNATAAKAQADPLVLLLHAHSTACYRPKPSHVQTGFGDIVQVGEALAAALEEAGIPTLHLQNQFDLPRYGEAFGRARVEIGEVLAKHPSIQLILDIHRDGMTKGAEVYRGEITDEGQQKAVARLYLVAPVFPGESTPTQIGGRTASEWTGALYSLAARLQPGLIRGIGERQLVAGPDMADPRAIQVYWGDFTATELPEALASVPLFAQVVVQALKENKDSGRK